VGWRLVCQFCVGPYIIHITFLALIFGSWLLLVCIISMVTIAGFVSYCYVWQSQWSIRCHLRCHLAIMTTRPSWTAVMIPVAAATTSFHVAHHLSAIDLLTGYRLLSQLGLLINVLTYLYSLLPLHVVQIMDHIDRILRSFIFFSHRLQPGI